jgi:peptide/nickel transport system ATP-binding protein/glutathione transport system ATP-binding protein
LIEREGGRLEGGSLAFRRRSGAVVDLARADAATLEAVRGDEISMVFQEPMTSLNPVLTIGHQIAEVLVRHRRMSPRAALAEAERWLDRVRLSEPDRRLRQYPHELSGGMRQRVMIAMALACRPQLLIADEPTTALDVTIQAEILELVRALKREIGAAVLFITHDMGVVAEIADRVVVMREGRKVEEAPVGELFRRPRAAYTRSLLDAVPRLGGGSPPPVAGDEAVLRVVDLQTRFAIRRGPLRRVAARVHAVDGVSLEIRRGETLGLVGESGSGKSTVGRSILKLVEPTAGRIELVGRDVTRLGRRAMRPLRRHAQMIFQDPFASLNPRLDVEELVTEPLAIHTRLTPRERRRVAAELLDRVGLPEAALDRYPHQFSGGQRQRLCIARALSVRPDLIIADEAVSALDVSVQAQVIALMRELQETLGLAYLFIAHDLAVVERISHRVAVMKAGRIVESGPTSEVLTRPRHAYTRELLAAVPIPDPSTRRRPLHDAGPRPAALPPQHA